MQIITTKTIIPILLEKPKSLPSQIQFKIVRFRGFRKRRLMKKPMQVFKTLFYVLEDNF